MTKRNTPHTQILPQSDRNSNKMYIKYRLLVLTIRVSEQFILFFFLRFCRVKYYYSFSRSISNTVHYYTFGHASHRVTLKGAGYWKSIRMCFVGRETFMKSIRMINVLKYVSRNLYCRGKKCNWYLLLLYIPRVLMWGGFKIMSWQQCIF